MIFSTHAYGFGFVGAIRFIVICGGYVGEEWKINRMASKRHQRRKSCEGKQRYSKQQAIQCAAQVRQRKGEFVRAYSCRFCKNYHVGHFRPDIIF